MSSDDASEKKARALAFTKKYGYAGAGCFYLFTVGLRDPRNREFIHKMYDHLGFSEPMEMHLPSLGSSEITRQDTPVCIRGPESVSGNVNLLELLIITRLIKRSRPRRVFEIGTFDGRTTLNMALNSPGDSRIFTLDLPKEEMDSTELGLARSDKEFIDKEVCGSRFIGTEFEGKIVQLYGDSAKFDFSPYHNKIDLVFIDGSHAYEYVLNDTKKAMKMLRNGNGIILWHDYGAWDGVTRALNELYSSGARFRRLRHVNETTLAVLKL